jgi:hypothetical protein
MQILFSSPSHCSLRQKCDCLFFVFFALTKFIYLYRHFTFQSILFLVPKKYGQILLSIPLFFVSPLFLIVLIVTRHLSL